MISDAQLLAHTRAEATETAYLRTLEKAAIAAIQNRTGRYYGAQGERVEDLYRRGNQALLSSTPIDGVVTLESWDGSAWSTVDATSYWVIGSAVHWTNTTAYSSLTMPVHYRATYDAGYVADDADANVWPAPEDIQHAVLLIVGNWYENRESVVVGEGQYELPQSATWLIDAHIKVYV